MGRRVPAGFFLRAGKIIVLFMRGGHRDRDGVFIMYRNIMQGVGVSIR